MAQVLSLITFIHGHHHGAPSLTHFSLSTSTCSSLSFPSTSSTPSCTLSSTTRSSCKACATPPTRRVRTPTTSPLPSQITSLQTQNISLRCLVFFFFAGLAQARWSLLRDRKRSTIGQNVIPHNLTTLSGSVGYLDQVFAVVRPKEDKMEPVDTNAMIQQDEMFGVSTIDWDQTPWMRRTLIHKHVFKLSSARVYVFSDSVLCLEGELKNIHNL